MLVSFPDQLVGTSLIASPSWLVLVSFPVQLVVLVLFLGELVSVSTFLSLAGRTSLIAISADRY